MMNMETFDKSNQINKTFQFAINQKYNTLMFGTNPFILFADVEMQSQRCIHESGQVCDSTTLSSS